MILWEQSLESSLLKKKKEKKSWQEKELTRGNIVQRVMTNEEKRDTRVGRFYNCVIYKRKNFS